MTIREMIKKLEDLDELMLTEIGLELTDKARERAHFAIWGAIEYLEENEED